MIDSKVLASINLHAVLRNLETLTSSTLTQKTCSKDTDVRFAFRCLALTG